MKGLRSSAHQLLKRAVRFFARSNAGRKGLNLVYRAMNSRQRRWAHGHYSRLFRSTTRRAQSGVWAVRFVDKEVFLPISGSEMWLEWDAAMSILGHEVEILDTYGALLRSERRPSTFIDIGANYGLQSILFLVHGVRVFTFEPNPLCRPYLEALCRLNHVQADLRSCAVSDRAGSADLWFPETETWLGSIDARGQSILPQHIKKIPVQISTLDEWLSENELKEPVLIKIDVEGHEDAVIRGAAGTLRRYKPWVIFESHPGATRPGVLSSLDQVGYVPASLPFLRLDKPDVLSPGRFLENRGANFIALPKEEFGG